MMKLHALLSHYDEAPEHLARCVGSLAGVADTLVAVDGAYAAYPDGLAFSGIDQQDAIVGTADKIGLACKSIVPDDVWRGGEVEKRAAMFRHAEALVAPDDWYLILDGDMHVHRAEGLREALAGVTEDVAEVRWRDVRPDGKPTTDCKFRSLFRALPDLTVKWTHYLYVVPLEVGWRYLWHYPSGHISSEPAADLSGHIELHHRRLDRSAERDMRARRYYETRAALGLERAPQVW